MEEYQTIIEELLHDLNRSEYNLNIADQRLRAWEQEHETIIEEYRQREREFQLWLDVIHMDQKKIYNYQHKSKR